MQQNQYFQKSRSGKTIQSAAQFSKTCNNVMDRHDQIFLHDTPYKSSYDFFLSMIGNSQVSVLELGCGQGNIAKYMLACNNDIKWIGIDYEPTMVEKAKQNCAIAEFITLDARELKSWRRKFDALILGFCLQDFSPAELCDYLPVWMHRVYAGGVVYLSFVEGNPANSGTQINSKGNAIDFYYYTVKSMKQALKDCGVSIIYEEQLPLARNENKFEYHTVLIGKKGSSH